MRTYADPRRCPACDGTLPDAPNRCPHCGLSLAGPTAVALFSTLQQVDRLLTQLRAQPEVAAPSPAPAGIPVDEAALPMAPRPGLPAVWDPPARSRGLSGASVPRILLTLGALCLLVAAITFLAVAWNFLGVGGRTAVLLGFTATAAGLTSWLWRRGLRTAAEALSVVTAGLLALDLVGADNAGWLDLEPGALVLLVGAVLGATGIAATYAARDRRPLWAPQLIAAGGLLVAPAGALDLTSHDSAVIAASTAALASVAGATHALRLGRVGWFVGAAAALWWAVLALTGLARLTDHSDATELWRGLHPWPLLAAALFLAATAYAVRRTTLAAAVMAGGAAAMIALPVVWPALDNSLTQAVSATLPVAFTFALAALALPQAWRLSALLPMTGAALLPIVAAAATTGSILESVLGVAESWAAPVRVRLIEAEVPAHPLLLPATIAVLAVVLAAWAGLRGQVRPLLTAAGPAAAGAVGLSGVLAVAAYPIPLAALVAALLAAGVALGAVTWRAAGAGATTARALATGSLAAALVFSLPSVVLTLITLSLLLLVSALVAARGPAHETRLIGLATMPLLLAGLVWTIGELTGLDVDWRATVVLLVVGAVALLIPRLPIELPAVAAGLVASLVSVGAAFATSDSRGLVVLALDLTVAGALVTASSLAHPHRRLLAAPGGLLLAMATWVRLYDLGVTAPEAYTLPSALVLVALGWRHLRHTPAAATITALGPGLVLATVPTLLRALVDDPVSPRPLLLGLACLALVLAGTRLRWTAPLVVGAVVGAVLVVRELGPYAADLPPWLLIAVAGALLTGVGVTWESRMQDLHRAGDYLARLR